MAIFTIPVLTYITNKYRPISHCQCKYLYYRNGGNSIIFFQMLTGSMLEKFTKRIEDLSKMKQSSDDRPHYNLIQQQFSSSQSPSPLVQSQGASDPQEQKQQMQQSSALKNSLQFSQEIKHQDNEQTCKKNQIPIRNQQNDLLDRIKTKIVNSRPESNVQTKQPALSNNGQVSYGKTRQEKAARKAEQKTQKQTGGGLRVKSRESSASGGQKNNGISHQSKRLIVAQILKETAQMSSDDKRKHLKRMAKLNGFQTTHELKIWVDTFEMIFKVQSEISKLSEKPSENTVSKKFAQQFIKYVKQNPGEKKYKFKRICSIALKQLNVTIQKSEQWLNRFMNKNSKYLKQIDLRQYKIDEKSNLEPRQAVSPRVEVSKITKLSSNARAVDNTQADKKQLRKKKKESSMEDSNPKSFKATQRASSKKNSHHDSSSSEEQSYSSDNGSERESSSESYPRCAGKGKFQKRARMIEKRKEKQQTKLQNKKQLKKTELKNGKNEKQKSKLIEVDPSPKIKQKECPVFYPEIRPSIEIANKELKKSSSYPENFGKKIAAKLDMAFSRVLEQILKQKCDEFCVEQEALKQMYEEYGSYILKKEKTQNNEQTVLIQPVSPQSSVPKRNQPDTKQLEAIKIAPENAHSQKNGFYLNPETKLTPSQQYNLSQERIEPIEVKEQAKPMQQELQMPEMRLKKNPFEILAQKLSYFVRTNLGVSQKDIRNEAIRIAKTVPEIVGRIREQSLIRWVNSFLQKNKSKLSILQKQSQSPYQKQVIKMKAMPSHPNMAANYYPPPSSFAIQSRFSSKPVNPPHVQSPRNFHIVVPKKNSNDSNTNGSQIRSQ